MKMTRNLHKNRGNGKGEIEFGPYRLTQDGILHCPSDARTQLPTRLICVLHELVANQGAAVSRLDLIERCWQKDTIGEDNLTRAIADLRKIFRAHGRDCIETVYGLGYRLNTGQRDPDFRETLAFCQEAWHRVYQRQRATLDSAEHLFSQAVEKDGTYLPAWLGLTETHIHRMQLGYTTTLESAPSAWGAIDRALDLEPACTDGLAMKGLLLTWADWDFAGAEQALASACERDPKAYMPNQATAWHLLARGKLESAERHFKNASAAQPLSGTARAGWAFARMFKGDTATALNIAREMVETDPHGAVSLGLSAIFEAAFGAPTRAVSMVKQSFEQLPDSPVTGAILAYALAREGLVDQARTLLESQTKTGIVIGSNTMAAHAWLELGEPGFALAALESGFATRCTWLLTMLNDPRFETLDCEPLKGAIYT